ncbi:MULTISPECIES: zinc ABC transporter ATP-binding protein AztA [Streptomyces]|uniref:zinc ABC transporter ATP-binding protein AztA n=1 Tax=Streptomyces TaxID=1883 RepID=UPI00103DD563|nr:MULTISPECIES: zinc ABC transporter ATP-binding protein AztA [Streptomyces]MBT3075018.1 metal ABC transporter ATP-binding protein [Streptomyces sp. COG21]MBT3089021.1 metal ABC transporter ATP-binding protein [Streptomyces sp. CYG21]MBT3097836.1 metal ABC transporter ATP-binding protein [Streptomyces sp. CBG30]MBT3103846.1 metal ABC transporter ATP-binding protein [Streptomyces sp. COG19]MBT3113253.1 metal ABC transporter ATP-binding protein [Streptomyces sp. CYG20]
MKIMFNKLRTSPPLPADRIASLRFSGLCAGYPGRPVLHQVSGEITELAATVLVGPNGSGKSTLLGVLAGVIKPTSGDLVRAGDRPPAFVPQRAAVGDVLPLTVRQTVEMGRWGDRGPWRRLTARDHATVDAALDRLGIGDLAPRQLGELSGGQRQRALIAQGLAQESDLLLLDEPTTGLDPEARDRIGELLTELVADGVTVVQATHDLAVARAADVCLLLQDGRIAGQGHPDEVLTASSLTRIWQAL